MDETSPNGCDVIDLLDEYMTAKESGDQVDVEELERRAGAQASELRRHIEVAERVADLSRLVAVEPECAGEVERLGRFRTTQVLGTGGYSKVYLAEDPDLDREIALKVLPLSVGGKSDTTLAEARALAALEHPSVVKVYEVGEVDERGGMAYIAMERIKGPDLRSVLRKLHDLDQATRSGDIVTGGADLVVAKSLRSTAARCGLVARVARALAYCHSVGIVHRDVKPENILVQEGLNPTLVDFGMARQESAELANATQGLRGTPAYFAPEQVDQGTGGASFASDQFSLGVVLYELLTLSHPFRKTSLNGTMNAISASAPTPIRKRNAAIPLDVDLICSRALVRDAAQRYSSIEALAEDLEAFVEHRAVSVRPPSVWRQLTLGAIRHRKYVAAISLAVGLLIAGWVVSFMREHSALDDVIENEERRLGLIKSPRDFESLLVTIVDRRSDARALDESALGRVLGASFRADLDELWLAASERLQSASGAPHREIVPSANVKPFELYFKAWSRPFNLVGQFALDAESQDISHLKGVVDLPSQGRLELLDSERPPASPRYLDVGERNGSLASGYYRFTAELEGAFIETEFFVNSDEPRWEPSLNALAPEVGSKMLTLPGGTLPADGAVPGVVYDSYRISSELVTWGEFLARFSESELEPLESRSKSGRNWPDEDLPAVVPCVFAREYAVRCGARLPSAAELYTAGLSGEIRFSEALRAEWTSAIFSTDPGYAYSLRYAQDDAECPFFFFSKLKRLRTESVVVATGFRLAQSAID